MKIKKENEKYLIRILPIIVESSNYAVPKKGKELMRPELLNITATYKQIEDSKFYIDSNGNIINIKNGKSVPKTLNQKTRYYQVWVRINGKRGHYLHRLLAAAFIPNPNNLPIINHISNITTDNRLSNLEWTTQKGNMDWAASQLRLVHGEKHWSAKLSDEKVRIIRSLFNQKVSISKLAASFGVAFGTIEKVCLNLSWKHVS